MNIGFGLCIVLVPVFAIIGIVFAALKGKAAKLISGFNTLPKEEQEQYDKEYMVRDMRNQCFIWTGVMFIGAIASWFVPYCAIVAYVVWGFLFFKEVHLDTHKAFEKYLKK